MTARGPGQAGGRVALAANGSARCFHGLTHVFFATVADSALGDVAAYPLAGSVALGGTALLRKAAH